MNKQKPWYLEIVLYAFFKNKNLYNSLFLFIYKVFGYIVSLAVHRLIKIHI